MNTHVRSSLYEDIEIRDSADYSGGGGLLLFVVLIENGLFCKVVDNYMLTWLIKRW